MREESLRDALMMRERMHHQVGYRVKREDKLTKPEMGHLKKHGAPPMRHLREFKVPSAARLTSSEPRQQDQRNWRWRHWRRRRQQQQQQKRASAPWSRRCAAAAAKGRLQNAVMHHIHNRVTPKANRLS